MTLPVIWTLLALAVPANAFYLPGMAPTDYAEGDSVPLWVNRLSPFYGDPSEEFYGYDYYTPEFHFCKPKDGVVAKPESLGSVLFGDRIYSSPFELRMLQDEECHYLCTADYSVEDVYFVAERTQLANSWTIDGLPVAEGMFEDPNGGSYYSSKFGIGTHLPDANGNFMYKADMDPNETFYDSVNTHILFNHFALEIEYHQAKDKFRVVGAKVAPESRDNKHIEGENFSCSSRDTAPFYEPGQQTPSELSFSYSVTWVPSKTPWATRWDKYLLNGGYRINWFALINTSLLLIFMVGFTALTLLRLLRKDIAQYNEVDLADDLSEEIGWKLVNGDVFRQPTSIMTYAVLLGTGAQILTTIVGTLFLALLGLLSPANRGAFSTTLLLLNTLFGGIGGFVSAAVYKSWGGEAWKSNLLLTPVVVPSLTFLAFVCLNFLLVFSGASGAAPIGTMAALIAIWGLISFPLSLVCGFIAFKREWPKPPTRVNQIPRQIPVQPWYYSTWAMMAVGGVLPFLAVSLQLYYVLTAIWFQRLYYMFGFLFGSILAGSLLCIAVTSLATYFTLMSENYHWQWRAFLVSGSPAIYVFLYAIFYMVRYTKIDTVASKLLYLGYMLMMSALAFLGLGCVGAITSYFLVRRIYSSIKLD